MSKIDCAACRIEAKIGTEEVPHPIDPRVHECVIQRNDYARYVVGFLFSTNLKKVVLLEKHRPVWQAGLLNGPGGHVEDDEGIYTAVRREFHEEAGLYVGRASWNHFACLTLHRGAGQVDYFWAKSDGPVATMTDEPVAWYPVNCVLGGEYNAIPNLIWLLRMAMNDATGLDRCRLFSIREEDMRA